MATEHHSKPNVTGFSDVPASQDSLGCETRFMKLAAFMESCTTPMTISIQGDWGSGKTSAMGIVKELLDKDKVISIDFNTWQYSQMTGDRLLLPLLYKLSNAIVDIVDQDKSIEKDEKKQRKEKIKKVVKIAVGVLAWSGQGLIERATGAGNTLDKIRDKIGDFGNLNDHEEREVGEGLLLVAQ